MIKAPFPYFGGKSKASDLIWSRLGIDINRYVEPFFGSGAVLLNRPQAFDGLMVVNDKDCLIANFWRAIKQKPEEVAEYACQQVNEADMHAQHIYIINKLEKLSAKVMGDLDYCDTKIAGMWCHGLCCWIGHGYCSGNGPWNAVEVEDGTMEMRKIDREQIGVRKKLPFLGHKGMGVAKQLPFLAHKGHGVTKNLKLEFITQWFNELQEKLFDVKVCCGDWERVCSIGTMTATGLCGVLFDPPYSQTDAVYSHDGNDISSSVREWCKEHYNNKLLRIALCGHDGEHNELESLGWTVETWNKGAGYQGADDRERIWFSPNCIRPEEIKQQSLFDF